MILTDEQQAIVSYLKEDASFGFTLVNSVAGS